MATLHLMCGLSLDDCTFFLPCIELIIRTSFGCTGNAEPQLRLPRDPRTVLEAIKLKPDTQRFVCCPKCFALYPPDTKFTVRCSFKDTPSSKPCDEPLAQSRRIGATTSSVFVREYFHQHLKTWLGKLLCRCGMEEILDRDVFGEGLGGSRTDIFSGNALRQFLGRDGSRFLPSRNSEGRYIFGLSVDAFNPFLNKQAGKKASVTAIYMVLLNLPPSSRYKVENMYLAGVIPGPREPSLTQINHLLRPLINELLEFWDPGVWYVSTPRSVSGKLVKAALVPLICDLKAARQVMGHGSHSAKKFCSICSLPWQQRNDLNASSRTPLSAERFRQRALEWKEARSQSEREKLFKKHGIRWSILLELPYWDPPRFTIIDSMHTILLGHLHRHCTIIWGLNPMRAGGDRDHKMGKPPGPQAITSASWTIRSGSATDVESLSTSLLREFCLENGLVSHNLVMNSNAQEIRNLVLSYVSVLTSAPEKFPDENIKRVQRGWFTHANQDNPKETLDFLAKVDCVPRSVVRSVAAHFRKGANADEILGTIGNTRKVVLSALYAEILKRLDIHSTRVEELVKSTEASSVSRFDITTRILELDGVLRFHCSYYPSLTLPQMSDGDDDEPSLTKPDEAVFCKDTLSQIWLDMKRTILPSGISPVPREVGSPSAGKLTADQWRTFCTVHLIVSLVRLWGSNPVGSRRSQILDNFLHLVALTNLLHMRTLTPERIKSIEEENMVYLEGLRKLYPSSFLVPKHHMSLHLPEMLRDFGPVHAWRTFAFERLNQVFQNVPTNSLLGT